MLPTSEFLNAPGSHNQPDGGAPVSATADRRMAGRAVSSITVKLTEQRRGEVIDCTAHDLSEGGVRVRVPTGSGLSVGLRYAVDFADAPNAPKVNGPLYATVVRTERASEPAKNVIGAGLRFDRPLFL